ncbi:MAG: amino acid ABC transporter permease [Deltaproteobacteria bacterium]|nr:MAG: amino acid ABC transporter permease [Deltaproteobacteria bacterium]
MKAATASRTPDNKIAYLTKQLGVLTGLALITAFVFSQIKLGYDFHWAVLYEVNPTYGERFGIWLLKGLLLTINISVISAALALVIGTLFGIARLSTFKPVYYIATWYVELFRNTPLLVQMFFWYFAFPVLLPDTVVAYLNAHNFEFTAAAASLSIYTGSYIAEIIRAGIQAVPKGHIEAAVASGLSYVQMLRYVVLPQAFRIIIPPLGSEFLNNMKNSSLAMTIGVAELCWQSQQIESFTFKGFEATSAASLIYLMLSLFISACMNSVNHHLMIGPARRLSVFDRFIAGVFAPVKFLYTWLSRLLAELTDIITEMLPQEDPDNPVLPRSVQLFYLTLGFIRVVLKLITLLGIIIFLFFAIKGLWHLNWALMSANLRALLIWTFPSGGDGEFFYGMGGLSLSFTMAVIVICCSFFIGLFVGMGRLSANPLINTPCISYIEIIRGNPLIMVIFWVYFFSPILTGMQMNVFWSATIAFIIFSGAYLAEIVRAGIQAISAGQFEAATAAGFTRFQIMRYIILPQALKIMIPAFVGQFITIFKDTSLAYIIGVFELTTVAQTINQRIMIYPFEIYVSIGLLYFFCCYFMSYLAARLENRLATAPAAAL